MNNKNNDPSHDNTVQSTTSRTPQLNPIQKFFSRTSQLYKQLSCSEISGSLGDLGTLIPLLITLSKTRTVLLSPALFFAGLSNIITGYAWDVPMCVQPMKSIAAVAIADQLSRLEVVTAGIWMGVFMTFVGVSNLIELVNRIVPGNVVSGIQVGVGLKLAGKGLKMVENLGWLGRREEEKHADSILLAVVCSLLVLYWLRVNNRNMSQDPSRQQSQSQPPSLSRVSQRTNRNQDRLCCLKFSKLENKPFQHPIGLYLFFIGILFASITLISTDNINGQYDLPLRFFGAPIAVWALEDVTWNDWKVGLLEGAIPQLPLTTLNSVISVCALAHTLYPSSTCNSTKNTNTNISTTTTTTNTINTKQQKHIPSRREVSISVGLMNLLFCPFGAMPNCHGAGGLAAQHRLGARHGASVVFLGIGKMLLSLLFGASALTLLDALPDAVLGVMLVIAGVELCVTGFVFLVDFSNKIVQKKKSHYMEGEGSELGDHVERKEDCFEGNVGGIDVESQPEPQNHALSESTSVSTSELETASLECEQQQQQQQQRSHPNWDALNKECLRCNVVVTVITASVIISLGKTHYGALSGLVSHLIYNDDWIDLWQGFKRKTPERARKM